MRQDLSGWGNSACQDFWRVFPLDYQVSWTALYDGQGSFGAVCQDFCCASSGCQVLAFQGFLNAWDCWAGQGFLAVGLVDAGCWTDSSGSSTG